MSDMDDATALNLQVTELQQEVDRLRAEEERLRSENQQLRHRIACPVRRRMPSERLGTTRKFQLRHAHKDGTIDVMQLYLTAGLFEDGTLGEIFIRADRTGTMARGALDTAATMISLLLQYGVPLEVVTEKLRHTRYEPAGFTGDGEFPSCTSALDLVAQWLGKRFGKKPLTDENT